MAISSTVSLWWATMFDHLTDGTDIFGAFSELAQIDFCYGESLMQFLKTRTTTT